MIVTDISKLADEVIKKHTSPTPIVGQFCYYFSKFNTQKILVVTDEDIRSDLRVIHQVSALKKLSVNVTVLQVQPNDDYSDEQKATIRSTLIRKLFRFSYLFPKFFLLAKKHFRQLPIRQKAKRGIYNDHSYMLSDKLNTEEYTLVICNNLIAASAINFSSGVDYIYDIHEFELFRNRKKQSIQRSFYIYLREKAIINNPQVSLLTISQFNLNTLSKIYNLASDRITCIYNQNFQRKSIKSTNVPYKENVLVYIGNVMMDRGLRDIVELSKYYDILVIACTYDEHALAYLKENSYLPNLTIYKGIDYEEYLLHHLAKYLHRYFLILINPINPSYRYALPNKFFQAQALGLPIIVYSKTYLAKIIEKYQCGIIFEHSNLNAITQISDNQYFHMCEAMLTQLNIAIDSQML